MWGAFWHLGLGAVGAFGIALILERFLGGVLSLMAEVPGAESSDLYSTIATVQEHFLFLAIIGLVVAFLARAHAESVLGGA